PGRAAGGTAPAHRAFGRAGAHGRFLTHFRRNGSTRTDRSYGRPQLMNRLLLLATPALALLLAGCASTNTANRVAQAPVAAQPVMVQPMVPTSAQAVQQAKLTTSIANGFVDPAALARMTAKDSNEANSAQFYALQFGRPGAPRQWAG